MTDEMHGPSNVIRGNVAAKTTTAVAAVLAAPGLKKRLQIHDIMVTNSDTATGTVVTLQDDTGTPVVVWAGFAAAGLGWSKTFKKPLLLGENKALNVILAGALAGTGIQINVSASIERI